VSRDGFLAMEGACPNYRHWRKVSTCIDRYNITDDDDLANAVAKLNGKVTAKSEGAANKVPELS
jgi:hypothetical protein